jgi:KaiC/GvpD/RAD55 family RecA-like ATPase
VVDFAKTGIGGLDAMLYGGIPRGDQVILAGGPGTGKTLLSFEFLYRSAKAGETSVFFALEETEDNVITNAKSAFTAFTDIDDLISKKKLVIDGEDPSNALHSAGGSPSNYEFGKVVSDIESMIQSTGATRVVIDSLSLFDLLINDPTTYRRSILALSKNLRRMGVTTLLTSEMRSPERGKLAFKTEFFVFDGIIMLYQTGVEEKRMLGVEVIKMRGAKHSFVTSPYEITPNGFNVISAEDMNV